MKNVNKKSPCPVSGPYVDFDLGRRYKGRSKRGKVDEEKSNFGLEDVAIRRSTAAINIFVVQLNCTNFTYSITPGEASKLWGFPSIIQVMYQMALYACDWKSHGN